MRKDFEGHSVFMGQTMAECDCPTPEECMEAEECLSTLFDEYEWLRKQDETVINGLFLWIAAVVIFGLAGGALALAWRLI